MPQRRLHWALLALVLLALPSTASAADFSIHGAYWDTDDFGESLGVGVRVAFFEGVQMEVGASYFSDFGDDFDFDLDEFEFQDVHLEMDVIPVDVGARFNFGESPFYLGAGGTLFLLDTSNADVDDEFGFYARLGWQFNSFFLEVGYRDVEGQVDSITVDDVDDVDDILDIDDAPFDLTGYTVNVGWRF